MSYMFFHKVLTDGKKDIETPLAKAYIQATYSISGSEVQKPFLAWSR